MTSSRYKTPQRVLVEGPVGPCFLADLTMNRLLDSFRPAERQKAVLIDIAGLDAGMVFIGRNDQEIVGYVTFHRPDPYTRWFRHSRILELGAIEVSREWRRYRLARRLLDAAFGSGVLESYVVITIEKSCHWAGARVDTGEYRKVLMRLFHKSGMVERYTNDSDIINDRRIL